MQNGDDQKRLQLIHDSIVRTMKMISEDFDYRQNVKFMDAAVDYILWFEEKYKLKFRNSTNHIVVKKGEIYYCNFGRNVGSEQDKFRPALILQNDIGNIHSTTTIVAPITDEIKATLPTHVDVKLLKPDCSVNGLILIEQLRCVSKNRLSNRMDIIDTKSKSWNKIVTAMKVELDVYLNS